ncbi:GFA family protein [Jannaschia pohangensis]|uniref:Uncharacterized conserved protein n=1 Tax=Jannaschia pohangensis TaxID=390807 RepID=A0A1I3JQN5_9RHOB|nr:GFA family protein [Jannaschia pohangensis]SFI62567.1 Uncharacterized conserved protein [Jannaschia pohangensis]
MTQTASCLCGAIRYRTTHVLGPVTACHCTQCRKSSGNFAAATPAPWDSIEIEGEVTWYASSETGRRGFCGTCGSYLFWEEGDGIAYLMAGAFDGPTGLRMDAHIFYADRSDFFRATDGLPCFAAGRGGPQVTP